MANNFLGLFPVEGEKLLLVLLLSALIGLEREEHKEGYSFGGIRTFPLIGLTGYAAAMLSQGQSVAILIGFAVLGALMVASFWYKLTVVKTPGLTSEVSGLLTYLLGALIYQEHYWMSVSLAVLGVLLLELKSGLEGLARKMAPEEIFTFTKFLLITVVVLPILPNTEFTGFHVNPFKVWLVVCAISGLSYGSYVLQRCLGSRGGVVLSALLGGAYSSTAATVVLAKESRGRAEPRVFSGATLAASGVMYFRLGILLCIFSTALRTTIVAYLFGLSALAITVGVLWARSQGVRVSPQKPGPALDNPLKMSAALIFASLFLFMQIVTSVVLAHIGSLGVYVLAVLTGVTDVDPFIMGLTQSAGNVTPVQVAASGILIAASSNNIAKAAYAWGFSKEEAGKQSFLFLVALAICGVLPLFLILNG